MAKRTQFGGGAATAGDFLQRCRGSPRGLGMIGCSQGAGAPANLLKYRFNSLKFQLKKCGYANMSLLQDVVTIMPAVLASRAITVF